MEDFLDLFVPLTVKKKKIEDTTKKMNDVSNDILISC